MRRRATRQPCASYRYCICEIGRAAVASERASAATIAAASACPSLPEPHIRSTKPRSAPALPVFNCHVPVTALSLKLWILQKPSSVIIVQLLSIKAEYVAPKKNHVYQCYRGKLRGDVVLPSPHDNGSAKRSNRWMVMKIAQWIRQWRRLSWRLTEASGWRAWRRRAQAASCYHYYIFARG